MRLNSQRLFDRPLGHLLGFEAGLPRILAEALAVLEIVPVVNFVQLLGVVRGGLRRRRVRLALGGAGAGGADAGLLAADR